MRLLTSLILVLILACVTACESPVEEHQECGPESEATVELDSAEALIPWLGGMSRTRQVGDLDYVFYDDEAMKPAFRDPTANPAQKADAADILWANPERYAITVPPKAGIRPMVEWEPMQAVVMGFPSGMAGYDGITTTVTQIAANAAEVGEVWFIVDSNSTMNFLKGQIQAAGVSSGTLNSKVKFLIQPLDSIWFIDYGPLPIVDPNQGTFAFADFRYYGNRPLDDGLSTWLGRQLPTLGMGDPADTYRMPVDTEGGTFMSTSDGICFTGSRQLYYMSCNQGSCDNNLNYLSMNQLQTHPLTQELEELWGDYAGCKDVIVTHSITDDGTGHIDMYLKVLDDQTVLIGNYPKPYANTAQQTNDKRLDDNAAYIAAYVKPDGTKLNSERLLMPGHRNTNDGPIPFTYINSTFINGMNLWPATTYSDWEDSRAEAQATWEQLMPSWDHVWIDSTEISFWSGAVHCITRTVPALQPGPWIADGSCQGGQCQGPAGGYDGVCYPNDVPEPVCYGPAWECDCNDCDSSCPDLSGSQGGGCDGITYEGCCEGGSVFYCENNSLKQTSCNAACGWIAANQFYDCGGSGADPSGANPLSCDDLEDPCTPSCAGKACGDDGCGGSCGSCANGEICVANGVCEPVLCTPECDGKDCGPDGCGGVCGSCGGSATCDANGQCVDVSADPCDGLSYEGTCDGGLITYCDEGEKVSYQCDSGCCGWISSKSWYDCYTQQYCGYCSNECEPGELGCSIEGTHAWTCEAAAGQGCNVRIWTFCEGGCASDTGQCQGAVCEPNCAGQDCGDDGCGGSCGTCPANTACSSQGLCEADACVPNCQGKDCGNDGCGGSCGSCDVDAICNTKGQCEAGPCNANCDGKQCGPDGCGGVCGACAVGQSCNDKGQCLSDGCVPSCGGDVCGDDGCGGSCGSCVGDTYCLAGQCEPLACVPQCQGKTCGDDGCGDACGTCGDGEICEAGNCQAVSGCGDVTFEGICEAGVLTWCDEGSLSSYSCRAVDKICTWVEGVGNTCVDKPEDEPPSQCTPACGGRVCGEDGCGGSCGACLDGTTCSNGQCVPVDAVPGGVPGGEPGSGPLAADDPGTSQGSKETSGCGGAGSPASSWWVWAGLALVLVPRRRLRASL
ncbi:MAG: agmatine deiminase family protein [Myxococcota bacterium]|nr:agmatine deiminase family protein [Myxococcota bacterium]MEE2780176.1 agmatine deiminase family protein [Myxococcota bacterium]